MTEHLDELRVEPISKQHGREHFACDNAVLDEYLKKYARQHDENNMAKAFVAIENDRRVLGYYCISTASVEFDELPGEDSRGLPKYPIPAALIGKLACDQCTRGQGLGARLLIDALQRIVATSEEMGIKVVLVEAIDNEAKSFYQHYGFMELDGQDKKLFLPIETAAQIF